LSKLSAASVVSNPCHLAILEVLLKKIFGSGKKVVFF